MVEDIARIQKVSSSPAGIKYKFVIQVPKGIKNEFELDRKNRNQLWEEDIKSELKKFMDYQIFILLHSGNDNSTVF
jgi:hypothetical protein